MNKALLVVGIAAIAGVAFASGGDGDGDGGKREPWTKPFDLPQTPEEIEAVKHAMCTCYRGGAKDVGSLLRCTLPQVYGDVPWGDLLHDVDGDHASLKSVKAQFAQLAEQLLAAAKKGTASLDEWCSDKNPDDVLPPPPPPDDEDAKDKRIKLWGELASETEAPGRLFIIKSGHNGLETAARNALKNAGVGVTVTNSMVGDYMRELSRGPKWNRKLYSKKSKPGYDTTNGYDGRIITPAWGAKNQDARVEVLSGRMPKRTINDAGEKSGGGSKFGTPWLPPVDLDLLAQGVVSVKVADLDPPVELLELLA